MWGNSAAGMPPTTLRRAGALAHSPSQSQTNDTFGPSAGLFGSVVLELVHLLGAPTGRHLHCVGALCWAIQKIEMYCLWMYCIFR